MADKKDLIEKLELERSMDAQLFQLNQTKLYVKCVEDIEQSFAGLEQSIDLSTASSDKLSGRVFLLDIVISIATIAIAIIAGLEYFKQTCN